MHPRIADNCFHASSRKTRIETISGCSKWMWRRKFSRLFQKNKDWNRRISRISCKISGCFHASSRKTRIETWHCPSVRTTTTSGFHASSRKTRIETMDRRGSVGSRSGFSRLFQKNKDWNVSVVSPQRAGRGVFTPLPEKQGLKQSMQNMLCCESGVFTPLPEKQGLKLARRRSAKQHSAVFTPLPEKQGLKLKSKMGLVMIALKCFHASSRKTRIETGHETSPYDARAPFSRLFQKNKDWN